MERNLAIPTRNRLEAIFTFEGAFKLLTKDVGQYKEAFREALIESKTATKLDDQFYRDTAMIGFIRCVRTFCDDMEKTMKECDNIMNQVNEIFNADMEEEP
jgi:hypothetical protein